MMWGLAARRGQRRRRLPRRRGHTDRHARDLGLRHRASVSEPRAACCSICLGALRLVRRHRRDDRHALRPPVRPASAACTSPTCSAPGSPARSSCSSSRHIGPPATIVLAGADPRRLRARGSRSGSRSRVVPCAGIARARCWRSSVVVAPTCCPTSASTTASAGLPDATPSTRRGARSSGSTSTRRRPTTGLLYHDGLLGSRSTAGTATPATSTRFDTDIRVVPVRDARRHRRTT